MKLQVQLNKDLTDVIGKDVHSNGSTVGTILEYNPINGITTIKITDEECIKDLEKKMYGNYVSPFLYNSKIGYNIDYNT